MVCLIGFYCNRSATSPNLIFRGKVATPIGYILIYIINAIAMMEAATHSMGFIMGLSNTNFSLLVLAAAKLTRTQIMWLPSICLLCCRAK